MRILSLPSGVDFANFRLIDGPRGTGMVAAEGLQGHPQTVASPYGLWKFQATIKPLANLDLREYRALYFDLVGGDAWVRVPWTKVENAWLNSEHRRPSGPLPTTWDNDELWADDLPWAGGDHEHLQMQVAAARGATTITLPTDEWGANLGPGVAVGFTPLHLAWYMIKRDLGGNQFVIWPPLRNDVDTDTAVNLDPVCLFRFTSPDAASLDWKAVVSDGLTAQFTEVPDYDVKAAPAISA